MLFGLSVLSVSGVAVAMNDFDKVEVTYRFLSSDIAVVFHLVGSRAYFCIVLAVAGVLFMPANCLYCADVVF